MQSTVSAPLLAGLLFIAFRLALLAVDKPSAVRTDGDAAGHVGYVKEYRRTGGRPIDLSTRYLLEESSYPNGFHKLIYFLGFDPDRLFSTGRFFPAIFDFVLFLFTCLTVFAIGGTHTEWLLFFPFLRMLWGNEGRSSHFNERALGVLLGNIYLVSAIAFASTGTLGLILLAIISYTLLSVSSKFSIQAVWVFSFGLSLTLWDATFLAVLAISFVASVLVTRGYSWTVLKGLLRHSLWNREMRRVGKVRNSEWWKQLRRPLFTWRYMYALSRNSVLRAFTDNPISLPLIAGLTYLSNGHRYWLAAVLLGIVVCGLVSFQRLQFIGEPERYLEYAVVPQFVVVSFLPVTNFVGPLLATISLTLVVLAIEMLERVKSRPTRLQRGQDLVNLGSWLSLQGAVTVVTDPGRISTFLGLFAEEVSFVWIYSHVRPGQAYVDFGDMLSQYPNLSSDAVVVARRYGARLLIQELQSPTVRQAHKLPGLGSPVYENSSFRVDLI